MKPGSLQSQINKWLCDQASWVSKGEILRIEWKNKKNFTQYLPSTVDRALRLLEKARYIAVKYEGKNTKYKWLPHHLRDRYIPTSERLDKMFHDE